MSTAAASAVLDFWFGATPGQPDYGKPRQIWFASNPQFDAEIGERFGALIEAALAGDLMEWDATPRGRLARILLLDQFPRNAWRGTPRAFAGDSLALAAARSAVSTGADLMLAPLERAFVYLPFEHAEDPCAQAEAVARFATLLPFGEVFSSYFDYAQRHQAVVERFGRFPHRNAILGRVSTPEEAGFLQQPGAGF